MCCLLSQWYCICVVRCCYRVVSMFDMCSVSWQFCAISNIGLMFSCLDIVVWSMCLIVRILQARWLRGAPGPPCLQSSNTNYPYPVKAYKLVYCKCGLHWVWVLVFIHRYGFHSGREGVAEGGLIAVGAASDGKLIPIEALLAHGYYYYTLTAKDPKQRGLRGSPGAYSLGVDSLGQPIWDLARLWAYSLGAYSDRFKIY